MTSPELAFKHFLSREVGFDFGFLEVSDDGFASSSLVATLDPSIDPTFREVRVGLSEFAGAPTVQVRFTFVSDVSITFEGWYVDDIRVEELSLRCVLEAARCFPSCTAAQWTDPPTDPVDQNPSRSKILFRQLGRPAGRQGVQVEGLFNPAATTPPLDPATNGVHFRLEDSLGVLYDLNVPGGLAFPAGPEDVHCGRGDGWRRLMLSGRTAWRYRNRSGRLPPTCLPGSARGLRKIFITDTTVGNGPLKYTVLTRNDTLPHPPVFPVGLMRMELAMSAQPEPGTPSPEVRRSRRSPRNRSVSACAHSASTVRRSRRSPRNRSVSACAHSASTG
jgi:hypothetical protein